MLNQGEREIGRRIDKNRTYSFQTYKFYKIHCLGFRLA